MTRGYEYAAQCITGAKPVSRYVKLQCQIYIDTVDGKIEGSHFDQQRYKRLCALLKIINNPKGANVGAPLYDILQGFQWLILESIFCVVDDDGIRQYQNLTLLIARKNSKSFISGLIMIIAMLTEPRFSKLYSISVNSALARETYTAMKEFLMVSPALFDVDTAASGRGKGGRFSITQNDIKCPINDTIYTPLGNNPRALDGKLISFGIIDEVGALPNNAPIEATRSSQITLLEKLTITISTRYPGTDNPMEAERDYARKVLEGLVEDKRLFALLYEPDDDIQSEWRTNDLVLQQANPLAVEVPLMWEALVDKRKKAIETESSQSYFLTKNCNIMASSYGIEQFLPIEAVEACQVSKGTIDWAGRQVYVGIDLSLTNDNTSFSMISQDPLTGDVFCLPSCFIPKDRVDIKEKRERVQYTRYINAGYCDACGDEIIDYTYIEDKILAIEETYGVEILGVYADPWHATATCQRIQQAGLPVVLVKQHSYVLGAPTLMLKELVLQGRFKFEKNDLMVINFDNCKIMTDTNLNIYVNKKKSVGKIDMIASTINACYGLYINQTIDSDWGACCI